MPGLVPGIHVFLARVDKDVEAGTSPAMTRDEVTDTANESQEALRRSDFVIFNQPNVMIAVTPPQRYRASDRIRCAPSPGTVARLNPGRRNP